MIRSFAAILIFGAALAVAQHSHSAFAQSIDGPPQSAAVEDMAVFEPYIGRFRSEDKTSDEGPSFFYEIDYRWYDRGHTIVSYALILVVPSQDRRVGIGDGYYYVDRINGRIGVFGVFPDGRTGLGALGEFDRVTGISRSSTGTLGATQRTSGKATTTGARSARTSTPVYLTMNLSTGAV